LYDTARVAQPSPQSHSFFRRFAIVVALAWIYVSAGGATWIGSLFYGIAPAAIAIISLSAYRLLPLTLGRDPLLWLVGIAVGLATYFSGSEIAVAFLGAGLLVVVIRVGPRPLIASFGRRLNAAAVGPFATLFPGADLATLASLFFFFAKAGAFVFGSGLAIVPFLHQGVVVENGWLSEQQFLDAVAVGLITPGPVVITAAFVGFLVAGLPGATVAAIGVFLPAYLLVVLPGRWILRHRDAVPVRAFIAGVSAAATGAIVAAVFILGAEAITDFATLAIALVALVSLVAIRRASPRLARVSELLVVAAAGVAGLVLRGV
jgi:chromate transporter